MAKPKQKAVKTPKKRSTKYGKLAAVCSKELSAKKAALVRAEKAFAKAQRTHTELLAEVARLDMLDRSLKALINGTEPPQNVRYVYNYPQWVWYGNPYGWYWNGNNYSVTLGAQNGYNLQGGQSQFHNAINTITTPSVQTITTTAPVGDGLTTTTCGSLLTSGSTVFNNVNTSNLAGLSSNYTMSSASAGMPTSFTTTNGLSSSISSQAELTVDLSTGAGDIDDDGVCPDCGVLSKDDGLPLSHDISCPQLQTEAESIEVVAKAP